MFPHEAESDVSGSPIADQSNVVSTSASTTSQLDSSSHTSSPQRFKTDIINRRDSIFSRVRQYRRFMGGWEGGQESGEGEGEQTVLESAEVQGPPRVLNWRMKVGVSKVVGRRFVDDH